jgi:hypothetical protein
MSCSINVVLPLPDQPAKPNTFIACVRTGAGDSLHPFAGPPNLLIAKGEF